MDELEPADAVDSVCIRTCRDNMESNMVRSVLADAGIRCFVQGEHHRAMLGFMDMIGAGFNGPPILNRLPRFPLTGLRAPRFYPHRLRGTE